MTIHISATPEEIAETVLLPGDPLRAEAIAESCLEQINCYNRVRGMLGYTGLYQGKKVSIQGTGMGIPSLSIYTNELITLGAKRLIRVGTCGSYQESLELGDIILAMSASTDSSTNQHTFQQMDYAPTASFGLLLKAFKQANQLNLNVHVGNILSSDTFYQHNNNWELWAEYNVLGVEMESSALYTLAAKHDVEALSILTVSDSLVTGQEASRDDRQSKFLEMARLALTLI